MFKELETKFPFYSAHKKHPRSFERGCLNNELAMTYSHMGNPTLPSALRGFTSEFGKGSGGSLLLWSPAQLVWILASFYSLCDTLRFPNLDRRAD